MFRFDASSIRLRTESHLFITEGLGDPGGTGGGYRWTQDFNVREAAQQSAKIAGRILRDEMARRFPRVSGPGPRHEAPDASILIRPVLRSSPNLSSPCLLELEIADPAKKQSGKFVFQTMAGVDRVGELGTRNFSVDAVDLAFQAASSPEVLDFLIRTTSATPE